MVKPLRAQTPRRLSRRRRHRTWMRSMILATVGWGLWWGAVFWHGRWPDSPPNWVVIYSITCCLGGLGMLYAFFTLRARKSWVLMASLAFVANLWLTLAWCLHSDLMRFFDAR